ncbi:fatty acid cis/trans isomerase [Alcanivorax sp. S6407]|uniref:fatty acid cis/trans isomerase n=1 Tax=Alcanivorax sp. S6407 TaxID=2926424 RepID=UPI001FF43FFC|nr:fatty acid cis/trans isomerase [Alcanivorax sp. S6407]MCK0155459.1 fatty acid cis/trans isomerase [Alcanivorax sp. S6407]
MKITKYLMAMPLSLIIIGCASQKLLPIAVTTPVRPIDYQTEIQPLLEKRCTVCHSCYNAACQLKLDSFEGLDRGVTQNAIYNAGRLKPMEPTRLFIDAQSTDEWRRKEFFSVIESTVSGGFNDSLMLHMLSQKMKNPHAVGLYSPETDKLTCAIDREGLADYLGDKPLNGMPYGLPALKQQEYDLIAGWLAQGANGPSAEQQKALEAPNPADIGAINQWERFLNQDNAKHAVTARYLYEHLFLAHINFEPSSTTFYELVRSRTAPGAPIDLIPSVRPYDDPGIDAFFYRFRKVHSTIVQKNHMVVEFDQSMFQRVQELFIEPEWLQTPHRVGYEPVASANPFITFEQIPPRSRYQFLLDNSHYTIMTFIHGPVCKGQIALNVIDDHFWVMFLDPDADQSVQNPGFLKLLSEKLRMPTETGSDYGLFSAIRNKHLDAEQAYYRTRQDYYAANNYKGLGYDAIWKGSRAADAPLLTIYRHFDSASVHKGALGDLPKTLWVIDYPLFERIYYSLVAGFDIYGNAGHQLSDRLYMDALRVEGESYFLDFLPADHRLDLMQSWNIGLDLEDKGYYPSPMPAKIKFASEDPKREFVEHIVDQHLLAETGIRFDSVNYARADDEFPVVPTTYQTDNDYLRALRALSRPGTPFVALVNDYGANLAHMRVRMNSGRDVVLTLIANRWHDNVGFLLSEDKRLNPAKDSLNFVPGLIGSYPNFFIDITENDVPDFLQLLSHYSGSAEDERRLLKYGVRRTDARFWETFDWFQQYLLASDPVRGGLLDLNRYGPIAD